MRRWVLWLGLAGLCAIILLFPLRLALALVGSERAGLSATYIGGTIWDGTVEGLGIGAVPVGNVAAGLDPFALLTGQAQMHFARADGDPAGQLSGAVTAGLGGGRQLDLTGVVDGPQGTPFPVDTIQFDQFSAIFDGARCTDASGTVRVTLALRIAAIDLSHGLSGPARCNGGALQIDLAGPSGMERLTLSLGADRRYDARLSIRANDPLVAAALAGSGLEAQGDGFGYRFSGSY